MSKMLFFDIKNKNRIKEILGPQRKGKSQAKGNYQKYRALDKLQDVTENLDTTELISFSKSCYANVFMRGLINLNITNNTDEVPFDNANVRKIPIEFILYSFLEFVRDNFKQIDKFIILKDQIEDKILVSEFNSAFELLEQIEVVFGKSIWGIDAKMTLMKLYNKKIDKNVFLNQTKTPEVRNIINHLYNKHSSQHILSFKQKFKNNTINTIRSQENRVYYADFLSLLLLPFQMDKDRKFRNVVTYCQKLCPIDKYIFIKKIIIDEISSDFYSEKNSNELICDFVRKMSQLVNDKSWYGMETILTNSITASSEPQIESIINHYAEGLYDKTIIECKKYLNDKPRQLILIDLLARSIIFSKRDINILEPNGFNKNYNYLLKKLINQYNNTEQYYSSIEEIEDFSFKFLCFDFIYSVLPPFYISYPYQNKERLVYSIYQLICYGFDVTPKFLNNLPKNKLFNNVSKPNVFSSRLSNSRKIRSELIAELSSKDKVNQLIQTLMFETDLTYPDLYYVLSTALIRVQDYDTLISIINKKGSEKYSNLIYFPMEEITKAIDEDVDCIKNNIEAVFFSFMIQTFYTKSDTHLTAFFIDRYLSEIGLKKPSEILIQKKAHSDQELDLLITICNEKVLTELEGITNAVIMFTERLKIINLLFQKKKEYLNERMIEDLSFEEENIYRKLLVSKLTSYHAQNKINIDFDGIFNLKNDHYRSTLEVIKEMQRSDSTLYSEYFVSKFNSDSSNFLEKLTDTERNEEINVVKQYHYSLIYSTLIDDFIMNSEYGLVRYLSSEIRHGVLPNHIRSVFEAEHLVTLKISNENDSCYEDPDYWIDKLKSNYNVDELEKIKKCFHSFSSNIDKQIQETNNIIKPITIPSVQEDKDTIENLTTAFIFEVTKDRIGFFREYIEKSISATLDTTEEEYRTFVLEIKNFIWIMLEECFSNVKKICNEALKPEFSKSCTEFISALCAIVPNIDEQSTLISKINKVKNDVNEKLSDFENWFKKPNSSLMEDMNIQTILDASKEYIEGIYIPQKIDIKFDLDESTNWVVNNMSILNLTRSFVTMYINCLKHGKNKVETQIDVTVFDSTESYIIKVTNEINERQYQSINESNIVNKVKEFKISNDDEKLVSEGGTGLYKVFKNLSKAFPESIFSIVVSETVFQQIIVIKKGIENEDFTC